MNRDFNPARYAVIHKVREGDLDHEVSQRQ